MRRLLLASASPRRKQLLTELGVDFEARAADVPEAPAPGEDATTFARRVARAKADAAGGGAPGQWILGADTVVVVDGEILGKPADDADAHRMLRRLSGRLHLVQTAVVLRSPAGELHLDEVASTAVEFRALRADEIRSYVESGEPADKAGAYAIQGGAGAFVVRIEGSYSNVVGLPIELVAPALERAGLLDAAPHGREREKRGAKGTRQA